MDHTPTPHLDLLLGQRRVRVVGVLVPVAHRQALLLRLQVGYAAGIASIDRLEYSST